MGRDGAEGPLQFLIVLVVSWMGRRQSEAIECLRAENRVLRAHVGAPSICDSQTPSAGFSRKEADRLDAHSWQRWRRSPRPKRSCAGTGGRSLPSTTGRRRVVAPAVDVRRATRSSKSSPWRATIRRGRGVPKPIRRRLSHDLGCTDRPEMGPFVEHSTGASTWFRDDGSRPTVSVGGRAARPRH